MESIRFESPPKLITYTQSGVLVPVNTIKSLYSFQSLLSKNNQSLLNLLGQEMPLASNYMIENQPKSLRKQITDVLTSNSCWYSSWVCSIDTDLKRSTRTINQHLKTEALTDSCQILLAMNQYNQILEIFHELQNQIK